MTDADSDKTRAKRLKCKSRTTTVQGTIAQPQSGCEGAAARLHLTIETIYDQIPATQQSVVSLWGLYSADRRKAERDVQAAVADLKVQIYARVQENSKTASFFAPIRRLPVEVLGWWQQPFEIGAHKSVWRAVIFSMPGIFRRGPRPTIAIYFGVGRERSARRSD